METIPFEDKADEEIASLVQSGKIGLFEILIKRYEDKIRRYAGKFISDKENINDALQDIFLKSYINFQSFDTNRKFSSWLYRIAHNELINILRKKKNKFLPLFDLDVFLPHNLHDNSLKEEIKNKDIQKMVNQCLDKLEPKYKEPLVLYYFEELNYREIADIIHIPVSTVGVRIKRAKKIMENILKNKI